MKQHLTFIQPLRLGYFGQASQNALTTLTTLTTLSSLVTLTALITLVVIFSSFFTRTAWAGNIFMPGDQLLIQTSAYSRHHDPQPYHNNTQELINFEWQAPKDYRFAWQSQSNAVQRMPFLKEVSWVAGGASFINSFSQRSTYIYGGGRYDMLTLGDTKLYTKVTAGLINGYRGDYRDKIPFNRYGTAPAILPVLGLQYQRVGVEVIPFGSAGVMVTIGVYLF
jgi:hypothetical protein